MDLSKRRVSWKTFAFHDQKQQMLLNRQHEKLERFTPEKSKDSRSKLSLTRQRKSPQKHSICEKNKLNESIFQQTDDSKLHKLNLTLVMRKGALERKDSTNSLVVKEAFLNQSQLENQNCQNQNPLKFIQLKRQFLLFRNSILGELKRYEQYIQSEISKIYKLINDRQQTIHHFVQNYGGELNIEVSSCKKSQNIVEALSATKMIVSKSLNNLKQNINEKIVQNYQEYHLKNDKYTKTASKFDKFFETMDKLRKTVNITVTPKKPNNKWSNLQQ